MVGIVHSFHRVDRPTIRLSDPGAFAMTMPSLDEYLNANRNRHEDELCALLRIASVSADSRHKDDVRRAADWVAGQFRALEFATELIPTAGHPIVFAQSPRVADAPTV